MLNGYLATLFVGEDTAQEPEPPARPESPTRVGRGGRRRGAGRGQRDRRRGGAEPQRTPRLTDLDLDLVAASHVLIEAERGFVARAENLVRAERQHFSRVESTIRSLRAGRSGARPR
jgi:hypothetical protein